MPNIRSIAIYNSASCNLKCKYCFISKNPGLIEADEILGESFQNPEYYLNMLDNIQVDYNKIQCLELWGSEPLLHIDRIFDFFTLLLERSDTLNTLSFSTNCSHNLVVSATEKIMEFLGKYNYRKFNVRFQISIDGPPELTNSNRGDNVCENILSNFNSLVENNFFKPSNVSLSVCLKPTIDKSNFNLFLDRDYIINYYKFFEDNFFEPLSKLETSISANTPYSIPNVAAPADFSREDGRTLVKILKIMRSIEKDNKKERIFKYYNKITWYSKHLRCSNCDNSDNWKRKDGFCGGGYSNVGLLPNNYYCLCHREFANFCLNYLKDYKKGFEVNLSTISYDNKIFSPLLIQGAENYLNFVNTVLQPYYDYSSALSAPNVMLIQQLANMGQILPKYNDIKEAYKFWSEYLQCYSLCFDINIISNGDFALEDPNFLRLLLNGAWDIVQEEWHNNERK